MNVMLNLNDAIPRHGPGDFFYAENNARGDAPPLNL